MFVNLHEELLARQLGMIVLDYFKASQIDYGEIIESRSFQALKRIKAIIENDSFSDFECVEEIVNVLDDIGSSGGSRHDF